MKAFPVFCGIWESREIISQSSGATSYPWLVTYFGTVNSGSVIVPLDVNLPAADVCDLINRFRLHGTGLR